jgi:RNA polymerase sigma-70 factor (family 1)
VNLGLNSEHTDELLLQLLASEGEGAFSQGEGAFYELYNRYWEKLFVVASYRLENPHEAEEVVQDVMLNLWRRRHEIQIGYSVATYLAAAVKYEVIDRLAQRKRLQQFQASARTRLNGIDRSTEDRLEFCALQDRLAALVKALPQQCRLVFTLSREDGLSQREIAEQLKISENTVETHMKKALRRLRVGLGYFFV